MRVVNNDAIDRSRLQINTRWPLAEKLAPKRYRKRVVVAHHLLYEDPLCSVIEGVSATPLVFTAAMRPSPVARITME